MKSDEPQITGFQKNQSIRKNKIQGSSKSPFAINSDNPFGSTLPMQSNAKSPLSMSSGNHMVVQVKKLEFGDF